MRLFFVQNREFNGFDQPLVRLPNALPLHCGRARYQVVVLVIRALFT